MNELQIVAMADQINAHHRDAMAAYGRFKEAIRAMNYAERQEAMSEIPPAERQLLACLAEEEGDEWLGSLLMEV